MPSLFGPTKYAPVHPRRELITSRTPISIYVSRAGVRRIVTGHNVEGIAVVKRDDVMPSKELGEAFPGATLGHLWVTSSLPVNDNNDDTDGATRKPDGDLGIVMKSGLNLQYTDLAPGGSVPMHRTPSLDYNILISGKLLLVMEDGSETLADKPGDIVVQRGTIHAWKNPGPEWARWVTILIDAKPAVVNGTPLGLSLG
ncbi:hypothetical protein C2E23DRAFT_165760 [Lenzites betulinus]|nr:hypothetical protein C2E23DRAFT_165760 [Lenzites betulinus]